ncbi:hypothetical protein phiPsa374_121 [Pseudomonas phage phiPsa374]|uniref:Uncharacterized protein n=2 Tax=Otagovirus TaxID=2560197 RepID=A0A7G9V1K5_9CAUD|nr:hypothetical protein CF96_gp099 [Pseudomonas phage phiPsa374]YP_010767912.1 hypothetical protein QGX20_gp096 [Pseudomonas phage phiPsa300]AHJ87381.1 hypothetical protein phiPsa374_121 [Pseudomonas phage phiPsa374]QNO00161.1 hypothetical protein phiPsa300_126 [Pseudomonas phage phiPsa300]
MKLITIKQFEQGELTAQEEGFYQLFSATAAQIAADNQGEDQNVLIAGITRAVMQVAGNAQALADQLGVNTNV